MILTAAVGVVLVLLLLTEVAAITVLGIYAWSIADSTGMSALLAIGVVGATALLWWLFAADRAYYDLPPARIAVKGLVLVAATYAIWSLWSPIWAISFAAVWVIVHVLAEMRILPAEAPVTEATVAESRRA
ncbi:YrdB family protein [Hoyosella rhizosphaerae]|uniref:DUF2568 domain-containing protein n=1 Tax=Hoyosella rhizosphaerae TaxID=1755582 RepID=A0A916XIW0_9ACTN|nr:YrdB family protein [Hoyosella rhizosphaerae]MBN4925278.1 YrdB family protein [Hoyosella rhizosphaerae]GGC76562.1 hypothetical protein GCM10011410_32290 [Hoyosella rhizosphaerae]